MSSKPSHGSRPSSTTDPGKAEGEGKVATAVSNGEESASSQPNSASEESTKVSNGAKADCSPSVVASTLLSSQQQGGGDQSDAASATSNGTQSESRPTRSRTRARSRSNSTAGQRNSGKRYREDSSAESTSTEEENHGYLDALASTLARLDERAYKRALLRDANSLMENLVLPMSFPWAHSVMAVVRNLPRDIDEMPAIQSIDDAEHEVCSLKHSNFDVHQSQIGFERVETLDDDGGDDDIPAVARRADYAGEIELVTCAPSKACSGNRPTPDTPATESKGTVLLTDPLVEPVSSPEIVASQLTEEETDPNIPGELSYRLFEDAQAKKRRKLEAGMARLKTLMISVRVDSTSSRRSLFNKSSNQARLPLLLPAVFPENFKAVPKGKPASRVPAGRSQMTWIEKNSMRASHRVSFKSYLTNEKIENGMHKRPREVTIGIRVNGSLLTSAQITADQLTKEQLVAKRKRTDGKMPPLYSTKIVSDALKFADSGEHRIGKRQCTMDTEEFTKRILSRETTEEKSVGWNTKVTIKNLSLVYVAPRIDCLPTEDGAIHVLCTSPGELPPADVGKVLNQASRKAAPVCTVCWRATSVTDEPLSECSACGMLLHLKCCQSSVPLDRQGRKCASCCGLGTTSASPPGQKKKVAAVVSPSDRSSRRSPRAPTKTNDGGSPKGGVGSGQPLSCALCPHKGGAISMLKRGGKAVWVHDVCRIWCDQATQRPKLTNGSKSSNTRCNIDEKKAVCALCGEKSSDEYNGLVKCAAAGCSIHFHPMCALYLSKCEELGDDSYKEPEGPDQKQSSKQKENSGDSTTAKDDDLERIIKEDKHLCKQYTFRFVRCAIPDSHYARKPGTSTVVLPVCFCGIHNPNRDRSMYGLYPGGLKFVGDDVMRVPSKKVNA